MEPRQSVTRTIIHVDLDAFFCSVEELHDPSLKGKAFAVGGRPEHRGVVASCSYPARQKGVRSAMSMAVALRLCPGLLIVTPTRGRYSEVSRQVMAILREHTPLLEQISIDEAFLDVTDLVDPPPNERGTAPRKGLTGRGLTGRALGLHIQREIRRELGISCSLGVATNKMVAKIATDVGKASIGGGATPGAICVVRPGKEAAFLAPLPVSALWGVGPKMEERLKSMRITNIGQLAAIPELELITELGKHGYELGQHAHGIDKREIVTSRESKSISSETTFTRDVTDWEELLETLVHQAAGCAAQLTKHHLRCTTVKIKVRWPDFSIVTRQVTLPGPTAEREKIEAAATRLLAALWSPGEPVRLLGVGVAGLAPVQQLGLFDEPNEPPAAAQPLPIPEPRFEAKTDEPADESIDSPPPPDPAPRAAASRRKAKHRQVEHAITELEAKFGEAVVRAAAQFKEGMGSGK